MGVKIARSCRGTCWSMSILGIVLLLVAFRMTGEPWKPPSSRSGATCRWTLYRGRGHYVCDRLHTCPPSMPFFSLKMTMLVEDSLQGLLGVLGIDVLEGTGVFLLLGVVGVPLLPATWRGGRGFSQGSGN